MTRQKPIMAVLPALFWVFLLVTAAPGQGLWASEADDLAAEVFFKARSYRLDSTAVEVLDRVARWMENRPDARVWIEGYGDRRGSSEYNMILGEKRAGSVKRYLLGRGIASRRLSCISYGKERSRPADADTDAMARDRRVRIIERRLF